MKKARKVLILALALIFVISGAGVIRQMLQYREGAEVYSEAEKLAGVPDFSKEEVSPPASASSSASSSASASAPGTAYVDPYADALADMDFSALREVNGDVLGWILIPGTRISYPIVQGKDNEYYLTHTWKKWSSVVGAIFLEEGNSRDFSDFNTLIYGHRMNDGSMFAGLKYYKQKSYYKTHPSVYITDDNGTRKYDIFAAYEVSTQGDTYRIGQKGDEAKQAYIDYGRSQSLYDTGVTPTVNDKIITLSTCTGNGHATRWVVQARLKGAEKEPEAAPAPEGEDTAAPQEGGATAPAQGPDAVSSAAAEAYAAAASPQEPDGETPAESAGQEPDGALPAASGAAPAP